MKKTILLFILVFFLLSISLNAQSAGTVGSLPLDSGYSTLGFCTAGEVMDFFKDSKLYVLVALIGILAFIYRGVMSADYRPLIIYLVVVMLISGIFIIPKSTVSSSISHYEAKGTAISPEIKKRLSSLKSKGSTPRGLWWISFFEDHLVNGIGDALNVVTGKSEERFGQGIAFANILVHNHIANIALDDPQLQADYLEFAGENGPFGLAVQLWAKDKEEHKLTTKNKDIPFWPGHPSLDSYYEDLKVKEDWINLRDKIYHHLHANVDPVIAEKLQKEYAAAPKRWFYRHITHSDSDHVYNIYKNAAHADAEFKDAVVLKALENSEIDPTHQAFKYLEEFRAGKRGKGVPGLAKAGAWLTSTFALGALDAFPVIQAYILYATIALFPVVLFMALLPFPSQQVKVLFAYFLSLFWVKSWTWGFILANNFSAIDWTTSITSVGGSGATLYFVTVLLIILTPVFTYGLIFRGGLTIATAAGAAITSLAAGAQAMLGRVISGGKAVRAEAKKMEK